MGYTTEFRGQFDLNKKLDPETHKFLTKLAETRRMKREMGDQFGTEGEFYVDGGGDFGQGHETNIVDYNRPPSTQPSLWLQWKPNEEGDAIEWDGGEKFYEYIPWLQYLISKILAPRGYVLNGVVDWRGEEWEDTGTITVVDNILTIKQGE